MQTLTITFTIGFLYMYVYKTILSLPIDHFYNIIFIYLFNINEIQEV